MKNIHSLIIINFLIILCLVASYFKIIYYLHIYLLISFLIILNIYIIYKKSNTFDKKEEQQKLILHKIKNYISVIMGYNDALNDNLINKETYNENVNSEINKIIKIIKEELYK